MVLRVIRKRPHVPRPFDNIDMIQGWGQFTKSMCTSFGEGCISTETACSCCLVEIVEVVFLHLILATNN